MSWYNVIKESTMTKQLIQHPKNDNDFLSRHHCYPKVNFKRNPNLRQKHKTLVIRMWRSKHTMWHFLFSSHTIDDIIFRLTWDKNLYQNDWYHKIFKCDRYRAVEILQRFKRMKIRKMKGGRHDS